MTRNEEMERAAILFHLEHPAVWKAFVRLSKQMASRGYKNYSVYAIMEVIRWETDLGGDGITQFKINNNHRPFYARWFLTSHPQYEGFFRVRRQTSNDRVATGLPELKPEDVL